MIGDLLSYIRLEKIGDGMALNNQLPIWGCPCAPCGGRSLDWIANSVDSKLAAFQHSISALHAIAREALNPAGGNRVTAWRDLCAHAQIAHDQIVTGAGMPWRPKPALASWVKSSVRTAAVPV